MGNMVESYKKKLDGCLLAIGSQIKVLGEVLSEAFETLQGPQYSELENYLFDRGLTSSDIKAAVAVAKGELDGSLFFMGVASSKILNLGKVDQNRLLSGEQFDVRKPDNTVESLRWSEMNALQRNQLIGPKGGGILKLHEQHVTSKTRQKKITTFEQVQYDEKNKTLVLMYALKQGEVQLGFLVQSLIEAGTFDKFIQHLNLYKQNQNKAKSA